MKKRFTSGFKAQVARDLLREDKTMSQIATEHGVAATQLSQWKARAVKGLASLFEDEHTEIEGMRADYERRIEDLYSEIGRLTTKLTWLQKKSGLDVDAR
jgi:transposase-like protein